MKQTKNQLITTMSATRFNISENSQSKPKLTRSKSKSQYLTPTGYLSENSRSAGYRTNSNFNLVEQTPSPYLSLSTIKKQEQPLYERLHNEAKELKEKLNSKENEILEKIKRESIPKIHKFSQQIKRKQDLFGERLYPYHKLNKLDTDSDQDSISFEYAHVATVRSNPIGISGEFDNDDFRNNIDSIFCDDEEIKNLYGNKPSFVKIYRGIKHLKKEKYTFKPTLSKNTCKIAKRLEEGAACSQPPKKSRSNCFKEEVEGSSLNRLSMEFFNDSQYQRKGFCENQREENVNSNENFHGDFIIGKDKRNTDGAVKIGFDKRKECQGIKDLNGNSNNLENNFDNKNSSVEKSKGVNNNNKICLSNCLVSPSNVGEVNAGFNLNEYYRNLKLNDVNEITNHQKANRNVKTNKKVTLDYFKNPIERNNSTGRNINPVNKSYTLNYSLINKIKNCKEIPLKYKKISNKPRESVNTPLKINSINNRNNSKIKNETNNQTSNLTSNTPLPKSNNNNNNLKNKSNSSFITNNSLSTNYTKQQQEGAYSKLKKESDALFTSTNKFQTNNSIYNFSTNVQKISSNENYTSNTNQSFFSSNTACNKKTIRNKIFKENVENRSSSARSNKSNVSQAKVNSHLSKSVSGSFKNRKNYEVKKQFGSNQTNESQGNYLSSYHSSVSGFSANNKSLFFVKNQTDGVYPKKINRAGSVGNCKEKLSKNYIRTNRGVYEIEDNVENVNKNYNNNNRMSNFNINHKVCTGQNTILSSSMIKNNMNINFSVNFLMNE